MRRAVRQCARSFALSSRGLCLSTMVSFARLITSVQASTT